MPPTHNRKLVRRQDQVILLSVLRDRPCQSLPTCDILLILPRHNSKGRDCDPSGQIRKWAQKGAVVHPSPHSYDEVAEPGSVPT